MNSKIKEKAYIITGAGKGLGRNFAQKVVENGGDAALISRTRSDLHSLEMSLIKNWPDAVISSHVGDLADADQACHLFDEISQKHSQGIKALICFAGA